MQLRQPVAVDQAIYREALSNQGGSGPGLTFDSRQQFSEIAEHVNCKALPRNACKSIVTAQLNGIGRNYQDDNIKINTWFCADSVSDQRYLFKWLPIDRYAHIQPQHFSFRECVDRIH